MNLLPTVNDWIGKAGQGGPWEGVRMDCGEPGALLGIPKCGPVPPACSDRDGECDLYHQHLRDSDNTDHWHGGRLKSGFETLRVCGMYAADGIKAMGASLLNMVSGDYFGSCRPFRA